ncbi:13308_t:CDS:10 [Ambispora gerdemannii]|uniref:13308_t:CDS:1 n=1 Tax=Ambispora gerdemannii TaxID=144530 RepID=A0A9N8W611_9GLOM|nr:13308_t:CDS:10 [Ambispora gerdemannii]
MMMEYSNYSTSTYPNGRCPSCGRPNSEDEWCQPCYQERFQKEFSSWTSGHPLIDNFIRETQMNAVKPLGFLQYIPFEKFADIRSIGEGGFARVYSARCIDGEKIKWEPLWDKWSIWDESLVALKLYRNSERICDEFLRETRGYQSSPVSPTKGLRPEIHASVPQKMADLLKLCWHQDPKKRPAAEQCKSLFERWTDHKIPVFKLANGDTYSQKHPQAIYTSRHFHFENLFESENNPNLRITNKQSLSGNLGNGNVIEHSLQLSFSGDSSIDAAADLEAYAPDVNTINEEEVGNVKKSEDCKPAAKETTTDTTFQSYDLGKCPGCATTYKEERWCRLCTQKNLEIEFEQWTSGNPLIDEYIQNAQMSATSANQLIEWIPFEKFSKLVTIGHGFTGAVYSAQYLEGFKVGWNAIGNTWDKLIEPDGKFVLKTVPNSIYITEDWLKEVISGVTSNIPEMINYYGITRNPDNGNLMVVMKYAQDGNLRDYLRKNSEEMNWEDKFDTLQCIANGLARMHTMGFIHRDLHTGNILRSKLSTFIADLGLHYSFEQNICGHRPHNIDDSPEKFTELMQRCWHNDPSQRPTAVQCYDLLKDIAEEQWKTSRNPSVVSLPGRLSIASGPMTPTENSSFLLSHSANLSLSLPSVHTKIRPYSQYQHMAAIYESRLLYFPDVIEHFKKEEGKEKFEYSTTQLDGKRLSYPSIRPKSAQRQFEITPYKPPTPKLFDTSSTTKPEINPFSSQQDLVQQQQHATQILRQHKFTTFSNTSFPDSETTKYSRNTDSPDIPSINSSELDVGATKIDPTESTTKKYHMRRISNAKMEGLDSPWGTTRHRSNSDSIAIDYFTLTRLHGSTDLSENGKYNLFEDSQTSLSHNQIRAFFSNALKIRPSPSVAESVNEDQIKESDYKKRPKERRYSSLSSLSGEELDIKRKREMEMGPFTSNLAETMEEDEVLQERRRQLFGNCSTCDYPNTDFEFCQDCRILDDILLFYGTDNDDEHEKEAI